jgi:hypothetical protein
MVVPQPDTWSVLSLIEYCVNQRLQARNPFGEVK